MTTKRFDQKKDFSFKISTDSTYGKWCSITKKNGGVCAGLVFLWYDYLKENKSILDELLQDRIPINLIEKIINTQKSYGTNHGFINLFMHAFKQDGSFLLDNKFSKKTSKQVSTISSYYDEDITNYMLELNNKKINKTGLHLITFFRENNDTGHIMGWTKRKETKDYVFFDANEGETVFSDYNSLINHINNNLLNSEKGIATNQLDVYCDNIYTDSDYQELDDDAQQYLNEHHINTTEKSKNNIVNSLKELLIELCDGAIKNLSTSIFLSGFFDKKQKIENLKQSIIDFTKTDEQIIDNLDQLLKIASEHRSSSFFSKPSITKSRLFIEDQLNYSPYNSLIVFREKYQQDLEASSRRPGL